jgi:tetratricopeptide (TPR) repeat protein
MSLAVHVSARFFEDVVEETFAPTGRPLVLGGEGEMGLPVPPGAAYLARVTWRGPVSAVVEGVDGRAHLLEADNVVLIEEGPVRLEIRLAHRFALRRMPYLASVLTTLSGIALLVVPLVGVLGLFPAQIQASNVAWCASWLGTSLPPESLPIVADLMQPCRQNRSAGAGGEIAASDRVAEYLERILRNDLDGADQGVIAKGDRQHGEREQGEFYLPAGDVGPANRMGGASEVALRPERSAGRPRPAEEPEPEPEVPPLASEQGTPVVLPEPIPEPEVAEVEAPEVPSDEPEAPTDRVEDREGWGVRDWYDQAQLDEDRERVEMMTELAEQALRIDPNDPQALTMLAFYQYLSEDYQASHRTYDKFIERFPEASMGYNNKALVYKRQKRWADEEALYRIALAMDGDETTTLNNLAVNLGHQKRFDEALAIMDDLALRDPDEPYAHLHRAKIHAEMGNDDEALRYLELALEGMARLGTMHSIEFRQDIRLDPSFDKLRTTARFKALLWQYYGDDAPVPRD